MNCAIEKDDPGEERNAENPPGKAAHGRMWSIVLAGGNGDRVRELIHQWLGRPVPKQYCAFTGSQSMLQHTLRRADALSFRERQIILIAEEHRREARLQLAEHRGKRIIAQPANRDTLPGIMLPLTHVRAREPEATIAIFPSDHFIFPANNFRIAMERAAQAVEVLPDMLILVGAPAKSPEPEYGWIYPGERLWESGLHVVRAVNGFLEKPARSVAAEAMARGALWNTMIVVAKARTLWQLGCANCPEIMRLFSRLYADIGTLREEETAREIYESMPALNFSSGFLARIIPRIGVLSMTNVLWCDWGRKERIMETLRLIGRKPNFPATAATGMPRPAGNHKISRGR